MFTINFIRLFSFRAVICVAALAGVGCGTTVERDVAGTTLGRIEVGTPRIVSRERLVNDRLDQEEFLRRWLDKAEFAQFDITARTDIRSLALTSAQLGLRSDPALAGNYLQQSRLNNQIKQAASIDGSLIDVQKAIIDKISDKVKKGETTAADAKKELGEIGLNFPVTNSPSSTITASTSFGTLINSGAAGLTATTTNGPISVTTADLRGSPTELFRDQLALREEIRGEIIDNALDDSHDLRHATLVRLNLDAMVLPQHDTSAWAVVTAKLKPAPKALLNPLAMALTLQAKIESEIQNNANRILQLPSDQLKKCNSKEEVIDGFECILNFAIAEEDVKNELRAEVYRRLGMQYVKYESIKSPLDFISKTLIQTSTFVSTKIATNSLGGTETTTASVVINSTKASTSEDKIYDPEKIRDLLQTVYKTLFDRRYGCYFTYTDNYERYMETFPKQKKPDNIKVNISIRQRNWNSPITAGSTMEKAAAKKCGWEDLDKAQTNVEAHLLGNRNPVESATSVYSVMPKETVQRVSEIASRRAATEFAFGLNAVAPGGNVGAMLDVIRSNEAFNQAIRRQPLVVGFTKNGSARYPSDLNITTTIAAVEFGWVLGPQFKIAADGKAASYRHKAQQQLLSAVLAVPKYWTQAELEITTSWVDENGKETLYGNRTSTIGLPGRESGLLEVIADNTLYQRYRPRLPSALSPVNPELKYGEPAVIVVEGLHAWRNAELYVGSQKADSIRVLPDMRGVVATFNRIGSLIGSERSADGYPITLRTSEGSARVGNATFPKVVAAGLSVTYDSTPRLAGTSSFSLAVNPAITGYSSLSVIAKSRQSTASAIFSDFSIEGKSIKVNVAGTDLQAFSNGDQLQLHLKYLASPNAVEMTYPIAAQPVVYKTEANGKIGVEFAGKTSTLPTSITLTLPVNYQIAFPAAVGSFKVEIKDELNKNQSLVASLCTPDKDSKCKINILATESHRKDVAKNGAALVFNVPNGWPELSQKDLVISPLTK